MPELQGSVGPPLAAVALLLAAAAGLGSLLVPGGRRGLPRSDRLLLQVIVGLNLVSLAGVGFGMLHLLPAGRSLWMLAGSAVLAPVMWLQARIPASPDSLPTGPLPEGGTRIWPRLALPILGLITIGPSLCLPGGWDELVYHCVLPRRWLAQGWPAVFPDLPYSGFPSLGEILFWLMAPINALIAPRLLVWVCWMLALVCLFRLLQRRLPAGSAAALTLVFATSGTVLFISADCYVESLLMMDFAALLLAIEVLRPGVPGISDVRRAVILGVLAGGAMAVKPTGGGVLAVPLLFYAAEAWRDRPRWKEAVRPKALPMALPTALPMALPIALSLAVALALCVPFYLRPWLATGNPLYPYLSWWFSGDSGRIEMSRYHHQIGGAAFGLRTVAGLVAAPVLLAFRSATYDGSFGWPLLILIVLAALALVAAVRKRVRPGLLWPAAVSAWLYLFWFLTAQQARFAVPAVLAFTLVAAEGLKQIQQRWRRVVIVAMLLAAVVNLPGRAGYYWYSWLALAGNVSRSDYLNAATEELYLPVVEAVATQTPSDAKVMLLFEHRSLYIPRECRIGTPLFQEAFFSPVARYSEPERIMEVLGANSFTHVLLAKVRVGPDQAPGAAVQLKPFLQALDGCIRRGRLEPVWQNKYYLLLKVRS